LENIIEKLKNSKEPSIRYKTLINILGFDKNSKEVKKVQEEVRNSDRMKSMLKKRPDGLLTTHPYSKWKGAHWVLSLLADLGYPEGDKELIPLREQVYKWLFSEKHLENIRTINGRVRRCASQEGNALYYLLTLGIEDDKTDALIKRLIEFQWEDGGWNCDKKPEAVKSSYHESLIPFRALALHSKLTGNSKSKATSKKCSELFLKRRLYKKLSDGKIIKHDFIRLKYPSYWHYDILSSLKVMAEAGFILDKRCNDAIDLLESKQLPDGGFPAEYKYYRLNDMDGSSSSNVDWGGTSKKKMNEFVTVDALYVLKAAGRIKV